MQNFKRGSPNNNTKSSKEVLIMQQSKKKVKTNQKSVSEMAEENMEAIDDNSQKILAATNGQNIQTPKKSAKITQRTPSSLTSNLPNDYINQPNPNVTKGLPFYLNELISYPKEESRAFITNFRQLLYENLLSDPEEPKNIQTAFMTTFGFESQLLLPIAEELQKF